jgi:MFS family permease
MAVTPRDAKPPAPVKRRGLYNGWLIALIASLASGLTIGTSNYAFGVFIEPLEEQYGWTRTQINTALVFGVASALISPLVGRWIDRFGSRPVMVGSLVVVAAGFVIYAGMTSLWHFYVASALIYLGLPGATMIPSGRLISIWFAGTRGRMMGFVTAGNNIGGLTMVPLAALVVGTSGWRWGYVAFAVIILLIGLVTLIYVRDRQSDVDAARDKRWAPRESEKESLGDSVGYSLGDVMRMPRRAAVHVCRRGHPADPAS